MFCDIINIERVGKLMTEKDIQELLIDTLMSNDPVKTQATLRAIQQEYSKVARENAELKQQQTMLSEQVSAITQERDSVKAEKETIAKLYHEKWSSTPLDSKAKDEPEIVREEDVVAELFK